MPHSSAGKIAQAIERPRLRAATSNAATPKPAADAPRIAFLFNAQAHQILHGITTAEALATGWCVTLDILSASAGHLDLARSLTSSESHEWLHFHRIGSRMLHRAAAVLRSSVPPKLLTLMEARRQLNRYDAIALPEIVSHLVV